MNEKIIKCEIVLNGILTVKNAYLSSDLSKYDPLIKEYVRNYFKNLGYVTIGNIRIL